MAPQLLHQLDEQPVRDSRTRMNSMPAAMSRRSSSRTLPPARSSAATREAVRRRLRGECGGERSFEAHRRSTEVAVERRDHQPAGPASLMNFCRFSNSSLADGLARDRQPRDGFCVSRSPGVKLSVADRTEDRPMTADDRRRRRQRC
jgi:hypothetical protein